MKKTIKMNLSTSSIQAAIKELEKYKQGLNDKNQIFVQRLAELGIPIIDSNMAAAQGDSDPAHITFIRLNSFGSYAKADLVVEGKDLLFIEFGAGVHYNGSAGSSPNPKGAEFGYTIGSYGKGHGTEDMWHYFDEEKGHWRTSRGTEATMPVYKASVEIIQNIRRIAREVFGS